MYINTSTLVLNFLGYPRNYKTKLILAGSVLVCVRACVCVCALVMDHCNEMMASDCSQLVSKTETHNRLSYCPLYKGVSDFPNTVKT